MEREPAKPEVVSLDLGNPQVTTQRSRGWPVAIVALACSLIGAGAVLAAMRFAPHWFAPAPMQTVKSVQQPQAVPPPTASMLYSEPKDPLVESEREQASGDPENPFDANPNAAEPVQGTAPLNPFSGAIIARTPLPDGWAPGSAAPAQPNNSAEPKPTPPATSQESLLVTIRASSSDPESQAAEISSTLQSAGASVRAATHYNAAGSPIGVQIIATMPMKSVDATLAKVGSGDRWSGDPSDRAREVAGIFSSRLRELRIKEAELREKYEEDATELVVVREEIQKLNQGMAMARAARSPGIAVILIGIGEL